MDFFKREVNEGGGEDTKLVGAVVPTNLFHYFNLFCVVDKRSKSSIIRPLVEEWAKEAIKDFPEKKLIKLAAEMGYTNYKNRKKKRPFAIVLKQQEKELRKKGISEDHIQTILKKIKAQHEKNKKDKE
jgi:hypothetical protein